MRHGRFIYIMGDVHGEFNRLNSFINTQIRLDKTLKAIAPYWQKDGDDLQVMILQCGDFAYFWPGEDRIGKILNQIDWLPGGRVPIYWVGGNHEDWDQLDALGPQITEVDHGIFYCPFGSTLAISPDVNVLFAGGAESHDIAVRLRWMAAGEPKCWWRQEGISDNDLDRLASVPKADWVISHTAPASFDFKDKLPSIGNPHQNEPSRAKLEQVLLKFAPSRWFFGHFHKHMTGKAGNCAWMCLSEFPGSSKPWEKIYLEWSD